MPELQGIAVATVTPFSPRNGGLDLDFLAAHYQMLQQEGVHGVVPAGTNGEFPSLTFNEKKHLLKAAAAEKGDMFMIAGVGSSSYRETIELADFAGEVGADAVLAVPPYYFKDISEKGIIEFYRLVLNASELPLILYNIPVYTGTPITNFIVDELLEHSNLSGIKDTGGDPSRTRELVELYPGLKIFGGSDSLVGRSLVAGAAGVITGVGNIFPRLVRDVWDASQGRGDLASTARKVSDVRSIIKDFPWIAATKYGLQLRGLSETIVRPPLDGLSARNKEELKARLQELGVLDDGN
jgi:4-hydroxy-tetrahydrodipicolinate synthase